METSIRVPATGTFDHAVTPLSPFLLPWWFSRYFPSNPISLRIAAADCFRLSAFETFVQHSVNRGLCHLSVPSPFSTWELS